MAVGVDDVSYPGSSAVPGVVELVGLGLKLSNLLVVLGLLGQELGGIALGLLDGTDLLLDSVDGTALGLDLVLGCIA